jgi:hypothetical protein
MGFLSIWHTSDDTQSRPTGLKIGKTVSDRHLGGGIETRPELEN